MTQLKLTPLQTLEIKNSMPDALEVETTYAPGGSAPPPHLHPDQDERFEVLAGSVQTRVGGVDRALGAGETIDVPRGEVHQMWNPGGEEARVSWVTSPRGRTEEWFRALDALQSRAETPAPEAFVALVNEYRDVVRFDVKPAGEG